MEIKNYENKKKLTKLLINDRMEAAIFIIENFEEDSFEYTTLLSSLYTDYIDSDEMCNTALKDLSFNEAFTPDYVSDINIINNHYNEIDKNYNDSNLLNCVIKELSVDLDQINKKNFNTSIFKLKAAIKHLN